MFFCSVCLAGIYGGQLLGVRSTNSLAFYAWDTLELVRRIMIVPQKVYWSESGELLVICTDESFFILRYEQSAVDSAFEHKEDIEEDGVEAAFEVCRCTLSHQQACCFFPLYLLLLTVNSGANCG